MRIVPPLLPALFVLSAACREDLRPLLEPFDQPAGPPLSLRETVEFLRRAHEQKAYLALRPYLEPAERDNTIALLMAVDELLAANAAVLKAIERASPLAPRERLDISAGILDSLDLFSREIQIVGEREDPENDRGELLILIAGEPPPVTARFVRRDGHWVYVPGSGGARLVEAFSGLTQTLQRIARAIAAGGSLTPEQVDYEYRLRILPGLQRMRETVAGQLAAPS